jgi:hypothetical protein
MALHHVMRCAPSVGRVLRYLSAVAIVLFCFSVPARADVIVVETEEQREFLRRLWNASQDYYLRSSRAMEACYQNRHGQCEQNMRAAIVNLPSAVTVAGGTTQYLAPIRNNAFRYERVFSLLFLNALVQGNRGAGCGVIASEAARPLAGGVTRTLAEHLSQAEAEVGNRTHLPEHQLLLRVRSVVGPCVGRA